MKSLLDILTKEKELVDEINQYKEHRCIFEKEIKKIMINLDYVSYDLQEADIKRGRSEIENIDSRISHIEQELKTVRLEIRKYFWRLWF